MESVSEVSRSQDSSLSDDLEIVSIIIPVLNEEKFIEPAIKSVTPSAGLNYEIIVVDGGSKDRTLEIVAALAKAEPRIKLLHNDRRIQSAGVNMAIQSAHPAARIVVRADSHALYPPDFVATCAKKLREKHAQSVVVTMETVGTLPFQRAVAAAQNSLLGNGGSAHRRASLSRFIDHGHHAAFDRSFFKKIGGYDETIKANEDVDLDMRINGEGGQIWLETSIPVTYFPRDTARGLFRQYFNYGKGRAFTFTRYLYPLKLRQLLPVFCFTAISIGVFLGLFVSWFFFLLPILYFSICVGWGVSTAISRRQPSLVFMGVAAIIMHQAWAAGFISEFVRSIPQYVRSKFFGPNMRDDPCASSGRRETQKS